MNLIRIIRKWFWRQKMYGNKNESSQIMKELVLYFASRSKEDKFLGKVKLMKLLFFSDITAYRKLGHSITGFEYYKLDNGPAPKKFKEIEKELLDSGELNYERIPTNYPNDQEKPVSSRKSNIDNLVSSDEMDIIANDVFEKQITRNTNSISKLSHDQTFGWKYLPDTSHLPIEIYLVSIKDIPKKVLEYAETL